MLIKNIDVRNVYTKRLALSESVKRKTMLDESASLNANLKLAIATVLKNQQEYNDFRGLNEALNAGGATQYADIGSFKKFTLDLTTLTYPSTIASELVITHAMPSSIGYIQYWKIVSGSTKNGIVRGDLFNDVFRYGAYSEARTGFTGNKENDTIVLNAEGVGFLPYTPVDTSFAPVLVNAESGAEIELVNAETGEVKVTGTSMPVVQVQYIYDQTVVPQKELPKVKAELAVMTLEAKPRRIAIEYGQMAAFKAKQEQGVDLGEVLRTAAVEELKQEIDTEVISLLKASAPLEGRVVFNKRQPAGVSKFEHFESFAETIDEADTIMFERTKKYNASYIVCARDVLNVLSLCRQWKASGAKQAGPYFAGTFKGLKVFVHPIMPKGEFLLGYNGEDMRTSAAVFAPYMAIVPTAELQFADGLTTQGFATLYDVKLLNADLLVAGKIIDEADPEAIQVVPTTGASVIEISGK